MKHGRHANVSIFVPHVGCPHQCSFCNQRSISGAQKAPTPDEVTQVCQQAAQQMGPAAREAQIAFFGGSFTAIPCPQMIALLEAAAPFVRSGTFAGIRCSTRPDAITPEILQLLRDYGVTAVELGAQSMDDRVLRCNGRGHTATQTEEACRQIRQAGLELGLQMMTGLDGDTPETAWETAYKIAALRPDTLRIYPTLLIRGTPLEERWREGSYRPQTLEEAVELCSGLLAFFDQQTISVIRLGLQASPTLERDLLAGPYHPAFRELCESRIYLRRAQEALEQANLPAGEGAVLLVTPRALSAMVGQKRQNLLALEALGWPVQAKPDPNLAPYQVRAISWREYRLRKSNRKEGQGPCS